MSQSTWEMMSPAQQAQCADAGRGPFAFVGRKDDQPSDDTPVKPDEDDEDDDEDDLEDFLDDDEDEEEDDDSSD